MRKLLLAGVAAIALSIAPCAQAQQAVVCVNCSQLQFDIGHQLWEAAQWLRSIEQQVLQVEYEVKSWVELAHMTATLPARLFNDITGTIARLQADANQIAMFGEQTKWMLQNLGHSGGYGGSLDDIPLALAQEDQALAAAMRRLGMVSDQTQNLSQTYSARLAALEGQSVEGATQAAQVGNSINATGWQYFAAQSEATNTAFQALATAEVRRADREAMLDAKATKNQREAIAASCAQLTVISPPVCRQQPNTSPTGGTMVVASAP